MQQALLAALEFRLRIDRTQPSENYVISFAKVGESFDKDNMTVASAQISDKELTEDNTVLICLCPAIYKTWGPRNERSGSYILKALVMVQGYEFDETIQGYPRTGDLPY